MAAQKLLTIQQAAERLNIHKQAVYRLIWAERIAWTNVGTRSRPRLRISEKEVDAYIAANTRAVSAR